MYKRSFVLFLSYFNRNRDYFECHEVLEEHWKEIAPGDRHHELVGFIQLATGLYHWRRGNLRGAQTILKKAQTHLLMHPQSDYYKGIDIIHVCEQLITAQRLVAAAKPFTPFTIVITDPALNAQVQAVPLPTLTEHFIVHKHTLRNRDDVISLRQQNLLRKQKLREQ